MKTAVEWFEEQVGHSSLMGLKEWNEIFEQAKAMEKEQLINAAKEMHEKGFNDCVDSMDKGVGYNHKQEAEQYYNETFKTDKG